MQGEKKIYFAIRKYAIGAVSVALSVVFLGIGAVRVQAAELTGENPGAQQVEASGLADDGQAAVVGETVPAVSEAAPSSVATVQAATDSQQSELTVAPTEIEEAPKAETLEPEQETIGQETAALQSVEATAGQPSLSRRTARSVEQPVIEQLPLDENGELVTVVSGNQVHQIQTIYQDGTSQVVAATSGFATNQNQTDVAQQVAAVKDDFAAVTYDSLYPHLSHQVSFIVDNELVRSLSQEKGGQAPTVAEKQTAYMDLLDMRASFERVQTDLEQILTGVFEKATTVDIDRVRAKKEQILTALTYLDRRYSFTFGNYAAKDLILYYPKVFGGTGDTLENLLGLANLTYQDLTMDQSANTYQKKLAPFTGQTNLTAFVEKGVSLFAPGLSEEDWFKQTTKAHIVEATNAYSSVSLYEKIKTDGRLKNHLIPLLSLSSDSIYAISTSNTVNYGLKETYVNPSQAGSQQDFLATLARYADHQQEFLNFWYRMTQKKEQLTKHAPIIVVDSVQKYGQPNQSASELYSPKFGSKVLEGVREFIRPLNIYSNFVRADGQANGSSSVNLYLKKSLTDDGQSVYTHELTHILDKTIWLNGHGRRAGQGPEVFARGLFESINNSLGTAYDPVFNLNTAYTLTGNRTQNSLPTRFQTTDDLQTYMQGILDLLYTLDYAEAQSILNRSAEDRAVLLNQISLIPNPANNGSGPVTDRVSHIDTSLAASLTSIDDFINQSLISARYKFDGMYTVGTARTNSYYTIPLFEPIYAALQNDSGSVGDISFKRNAYEILGEYGYENGMVAYISNQYATDQAALAAIMPAYSGDLSAFKKAMFARRIDKLSDLKETAVASDFATIQTLMDQAVAQDLLQLKTNAQNNTYLSHRVTAVRDLKTSLYQAYLAATDEFRTSIYRVQQARELYVTNGQEDSSDGLGTETSPYQSLSYAIRQAKDGDTIKLLSDVNYRKDGTFVIDKAVTIDGQGRRLTFRGPDLVMAADVTLTNLILNMIPDGSHQPTIYAGGHHLTFDTVSTTINQTQTTLRPTLVAGSHTGEPTGSHAQISIVNGDSNTRFHQIFAGNAQGLSQIPVTIRIDSEFAGVDQGISLTGPTGLPTMERVEIDSNSRLVKKIDGRDSLDNAITLRSAIIYGMTLLGIHEVRLADGANISLSADFEGLEGTLTLDAGSKMWLNQSGPATIGQLNGAGELVLATDASLTVLGDVEDSPLVNINLSEMQAATRLNKEYVTVEGTASPAFSVSLLRPLAGYRVEKDGVLYKLLADTPVQQEVTLTLDFHYQGTSLGRQEIQLPLGQSLTDFTPYLPQASEGSYEVASSFEVGQVSNIQTSKTVVVPLILRRPDQPILVFDPNQVTALTIEQVPAKVVYREGESLDTAGLQIKLTDHQGLSQVIQPDQFAAHGITLTEGILSPEIRRVLVQKGTLQDGFDITVHPLKSTLYPARVIDGLIYETDDEVAAIVQLLANLIQVDSQAGPVEKELAVAIVFEAGAHRIPMRVIYDDGSQLTVEVAVTVQLPLQTQHGAGARHELGVGVLPPLETQHGAGVRHELGIGVLPPLETQHGAGVRHELGIGVLPPLETQHGAGVRHELGVGVLPPLETQHGAGVRHELGVGVLPPLEIQPSTEPHSLHLPHQVGHKPQPSGQLAVTDKPAPVPSAGDKPVVARPVRELPYTGQATDSARSLLLLGLLGSAIAFLLRKKRQ